MPRVHEPFIYILSVQVFSVLTWSDLHLPPYISYILYLYLIIYIVLCLFILSNFIDLFMLRSNIVFMYSFWLSIVINRGKEGTEAYVDKFGFKEVCSQNNKLWLISFLINNPIYRILQIFSCPEKIFLLHSSMKWTLLLWTKDTFVQIPTCCGSIPQEEKSKQIENYGIENHKFLTLFIVKAYIIKPISDN